jgi:hypothetical protein
VSDADLYPRPTREQIAAKIRGVLPGAEPKPEPSEPTDYLTNFGTHLRARMRALGWDQAQLQSRAGIGVHIAARAINGTGCDIGVAGKIAALVGISLTAMISSYRCGTCHGEPPAGYACLECGTETRPS